MVPTAPGVKKIEWIRPGQPTNTQKIDETCTVTVQVWSLNTSTSTKLRKYQTQVGIELELTQLPNPHYHYYEFKIGSAKCQKIRKLLDYQRWGTAMVPPYRDASSRIWRKSGPNGIVLLETLQCSELPSIYNGCVRWKRKFCIWLCLQHVSIWSVIRPNKKYIHIPNIDQRFLSSSWETPT